MNIFRDARARVVKSIAHLAENGEIPKGMGLDAVTVDPPRDPAHGDLSTNAAIVLARGAGFKPRQLADKLVPHLAAAPVVASAEVAGPGFINMRLEPFVWHQVLQAVLRNGTNFGRANIGNGARVNLEFVSANPTGPLHVGHTRGAVFGDVLASLLEYCGYGVTREYYINDGGAQVDALARSVYARYLEALGHEVTADAIGYPADYLVDTGKQLLARYGRTLLNKDEDEWLPLVRECAVTEMMKLIRADLDTLGIQMDVFFSEKSLFASGRIEAAIERLDRLGLIYQGVLPPPKGEHHEAWEAREQTLFRSTAHGDDVDRPVCKADGTWAYFAPDIAYHFDKLNRGFAHLIDVFGADHGGYVKRMKAAVAALSDGKAQLEIKTAQMVRLLRDGQPVKMSKRAGNFVSMRELVDEIGPDVTRFMMLTRRIDAPLVFDFAGVLEQSRNNPVFYVQYAHARICSVFRRLEERGCHFSDDELATSELALLVHPAELAILANLALWPRVIERAARHHEPHRIANYLYDLAGSFHALWHLGNENKDLRFVPSDAHTPAIARLAMARAVAVVITAGLGILGVKPVDEMR